MDQATVDELGRWLDGQLTTALGDRHGKLSVSLLTEDASVADATTVFLVRDAAARSRAVVLCSAPASPEMVHRAMRCAHQAKEALGGSLGDPILDPIAEGRVRGLSCAVLPYCRKLTESIPFSWIQRALLRRPLLKWLSQLTERTVRKVDDSDVDRSFGEPLRHMMSLQSINDRLRSAAGRAIQRLDSGKWRPRYVLMHGDLWRGNVLIQPTDHARETRRWQDRFVIIDWAGSVVQGYAMYDLARLAQSMSLNGRDVRSEVDRHCHLLECESMDAYSYLVAALGHIAMNLEHFPFGRYVSMAERSLIFLESALRSPPKG